MESTPLAFDTLTPDSGSGSNKQARKLQLRKAGFKAKDLPTSHMSPKTSGSWSRANISATLASKISESDLKSPSADIQPIHSILKEVGNSSRRRKKQVRPRIDDSIFIYQDENVTASPKPGQMELECVREYSPRCATPASRPRSSSKATPASRMRRQSVSIDTVKYIEHLESELAAVQTQLAAMTSPTVLQAKSLKMRALNAETRALQDEVAGWEHKFHERVQDEIEERTKIEAGLKARIRLLEGDTEDYAQKVKELQSQLEKSATFMAAAESANFELERRIDAISGLVASPRKSEVERSHSIARRRHSRHKSLLPRFPTTGSLNLPSRGPDATPATPNLSKPMSGRSSSVDQGNSRRALRVDINKEALDALTGGNMAEQSTPSSEAPSSTCSSKRFSWATPDCYTSLETVAASTGRPSRRMRRFHAGSVMPKPLLLPSTASYAYAVPATAPVQEREQTPPQFPFPELPNVAEVPSTRHFDFLLSPMPGNGRRRALTCIEDVAAAMRRTSNPFTSPLPFSAAMAKSSSQSGSSGIPLSDRTPADLSSIDAPIVGRNLFEELQKAAEGSDPSDPPEFISMSRAISASSTDTPRASQTGSIRFNTSQVGLRKRAWTSHHRTVSDQTGIAAASLQRYDDGDSEDEDDEETGFFALVADIFRQTYDTARQALMYAQNVTLRSTTVQRLQWWLVQVLLGPMMTRRMMARSMREGRRQRRLHHVQTLSRSRLHRSRMAEVPGPSIWVEGMEGGGRSSGRSSGELQVSWINRHNPWLWIRFSLALIFAIGAALRDGPGMVLGVQEEEERID
ncbi:hypothetical protein KVT40_004776 [Elsinoe batatas]|uniref:Uncharacterized protein n=1 Tax=Elsinoe batatas TaxID=2601811 RepID=A0A8K0L7S6_9PEZI|nr:hypothetical protein KVT40_004776 [Elsinoe batatas]